jgi:protein-S-isoprenylcysteine O-methyltransferase Ste14
MKRFGEVVIKYRAFVGIVCLIVVLILAKPSNTSILVGFFLILTGMFFRAWSAGYINKDRELAKDGPYSLTRNPLYFGNLILGSGIAVASNQKWAYIIFGAYYILFFTFLMWVEHRRMQDKFGSEYAEMAKRTNVFFPRIGRVANANFNISYYMKNKEYRVLFYSLLVVAVLIVKFLLTPH